MGEGFNGIGTSDDSGSFEAGIWNDKALAKVGADMFDDTDVVGALSHDSDNQ